MIMQDDRTPEEMKTHPVLWGGTDSFMSGWGAATQGKSYAFWACTLDHDSQVRRWVESRKDIKRVRQVASNYKPSGNVRGHCHIYVVGENHPAIS